jgi:hypothetical protein
MDPSGMIVSSVLEVVPVMMVTVGLHIAKHVFQAHGVDRADFDVLPSFRTKLSMISDEGRGEVNIEEHA